MLYVHCPTPSRPAVHASTLNVALQRQIPTNNMLMAYERRVTYRKTLIVHSRVYQVLFGLDFGNREPENLRAYLVYLGQ